VSHRTLVIIPAFLERGRIGPIVREIRELYPDFVVVVVDDGSTDGTGDEACAAGARVIRHANNLGYGTALHTGYHYAKRTGCSRVLQMDADGQHEVRMLPRLMQALDDGADIALGSRYLHGAPPKTSLGRRLGSALFGWVASIGTGMRITDPTSGFQGLSRRALEAVTNDGYPEDFPDTDVLIALARQGLQLREVPVRMHEREGGVSMHGGTRIAYYGYKMMITLLLMPIRRKTPFRKQDSVAGRAT